MIAVCSVQNVYSLADQFVSSVNVFSAWDKFAHIWKTEVEHQQGEF